MTTSEANGEWHEVQVIETLEELRGLTPEQLGQLLDGAEKYFPLADIENPKK